MENTIRIRIYRSPRDKNPVEVFTNSITEADRLVETLSDHDLPARLAVANVTWNEESGH